MCFRFVFLLHLLVLVFSLLIVLKLPLVRYAEGVVSHIAFRCYKMYIQTECLLFALPPRFRAQCGKQHPCDVCTIFIEMDKVICNLIAPLLQTSIP